MFATIHVNGLSETEQKAREIIEHVEAIRKLQGEMGYSLTVDVEMNEKAASGN